MLRRLKTPTCREIFRRYCQKSNENSLLHIGKAASITKVFNNEDITQYALLTHDFNGLHVDEDMAKKSRFGQRIVHGVLTVGLLSGVMGTKLPGQGSVVISYSITHPAPLYIGEEVTAQVTVEEIKGRLVKLSLLCTSTKDKVVTRGEAQLLVPVDKVRTTESKSS